MSAERRKTRAALGIAAACTLALAVLTLTKIPLHEWNRTPETPFDLTSAGEAVQIHLFLTRAADQLPRGTTVAFWSRPADQPRIDRWRRYARALLPDRKIVVGGAPADFLVVSGAPNREPLLPGLTLVYETPYASVWKFPGGGSR